jgi:hypothetical protein
MARLDDEEGWGREMRCAFRPMGGLVRKKPLRVRWGVDLWQGERGLIVYLFVVSVSIRFMHKVLRHTEDRISNNANQRQRHDERRWVNSSNKL